MHSHGDGKKNMGQDSTKTNVTAPGYSIYLVRNLKVFLVTEGDKNLLCECLGKGSYLLQYFFQKKALSSSLHKRFNEETGKISHVFELTE